MPELPNKGVKPQDPSIFTNKELLRHAEFYLFRDGSLPFEWQKVVLKRLFDLLHK